MAAVSALSFLLASAQDPVLSEQKVQQIRGNCLTTKNTLTQLHASDALLRVNRGQLYESIYTKLMDRFNIRVASNKLNNDDLKKTADDYRNTLDIFRSDYKSYEEQLAKTLDIDCTAQPTQFYDAIVLARSMREVVHGDVVKLNQYVDQYQTDVDKFSSSYQQESGNE